jgi:hypothetical protein
MSAASYSVSLTFASNNVSATHFAPACLSANGFTPTCTELADDLETFFTNAAASVAGSTAAYTAFGCKTTGDGGCDCEYSYQLVLSDQGTWSTSGDVLSLKSLIAPYQYNGAQAATVEPVQPMQATYCASTSQLTLTGYRGASLFEAIGLRSMTLTKM